MGLSRTASIAGTVVALAVLTGCAGTNVINPERLSSEDISTSSTGSGTSSTGPKTPRISATAPVKRDIEKLTASATPGSNAYKVGPLDVLELSVFKVPELSQKVEVAAEGTVNLPLVGEVPAAGLTTREIEQNVTKLLGEKYLQNPQVTVIVAQYNSQRITIEGSVKKPGVFPIQGRLTLLQSIAVAGGLDKTADTSVLVFRQKNGRKSAARFELNEIRAGTAKDPQLHAGDVIVVKNSFAKEAFNGVLQALPLARIFVPF